MTHAHDDEVREQPAVTAAGAGAVTAGAAPSSRDRFCRTAFGPTAATTAAAACEISGCSASCAFRFGRVGPLALLFGIRTHNADSGR